MADPATPDALVVQAQVLLDRGKPADALRAADAAVAVAPSADSAHRVRATALSLLGRHRDALAAAERALAMDPQSAAVHDTLALVALNASRWRDAEEHARRALSLSPENPHALRVLGIALVKQGRKGEGAQFLDSATKLEPRDAAPRRSAVAAVGGGGIVSVAMVVLGRLLVFEHSDNPVVWVLLALAGAVVFTPMIRSRARSRTRGVYDPGTDPEILKALRSAGGIDRPSFVDPGKRPAWALAVMLIVGLTTIAGGATVITSASGADALPVTITGGVLVALGGFVSGMAVWGFTRRSASRR